MKTAILYTAFSIKTSYVSWKSLCDLQTAERIMKLLLLTQHTIILKHFKSYKQLFLMTEMVSLSISKLRN